MIDIAIEDYEGFWIPGYEDHKTVTWITTHFYRIEMRVPYEILKFEP